MTTFRLIIREPVVRRERHGTYLDVDYVEIEADFYELKPDGSIAFYIGADMTETFGAGEFFGVDEPSSR